MTLADIWTRWIKPVIKVLAAIAGAILAIVIGRGIVELVRTSREGRVQGGGQTFRPSPQDPTIILVETSRGTEPVQLPPGIMADDVRAVLIVPAQPATVEVRHAQKDRRSASLLASGGLNGVD